MKIKKGLSVLIIIPLLLSSCTFIGKISPSVKNSPSSFLKNLKPAEKDRKSNLESLKRSIDELESSSILFRSSISEGKILIEPYGAYDELKKILNASFNTNGDIWSKVTLTHLTKSSYDTVPVSEILDSVNDSGITLEKHEDTSITDSRKFTGSDSISYMNAKYVDVILGQIQFTAAFRKSTAASVPAGKYFVIVNNNSKGKWTSITYLTKEFSIAWADGKKSVYYIHPDFQKYSVMFFNSFLGDASASGKKDLSNPGRSLSLPEADTSIATGYSDYIISSSGNPDEIIYLEYGLTGKSQGFINEITSEPEVSTSYRLISSNIETADQVLDDAGLALKAETLGISENNLKKILDEIKVRARYDFLRNAALKNIRVKISLTGGNDV